MGVPNPCPAFQNLEHFPDPGYGKPAEVGQGKTQNLSQFQKGGSDPMSLGHDLLKEGRGTFLAR